MPKHLILVYGLIGICFSAFPQTSHKEVTASQGDGIYSILRDNGLDPSQYFKTFIELNKDHLKPDQSLTIGKTYLLPVIEKDSTHVQNTLPVTDSILQSEPEKPVDTPALDPKSVYPIFGKGYENVPIESDALKGGVYYLISGHGGPDPGATVTYGNRLISEDEYAYDVTLRLARKLIAHGAQVYLIVKDPDDGIRDERILAVDYDEVNYPNQTIPRSQKLRLRQRTKAVNRLYLKHRGQYQRLIVTHVDSRSIGKNIDVFFYHYKYSKSGKKLAENIHNTFKQKYAKHQPNRTYSGTVNYRGLYLVKNTLPAMVYIELGNIRNKKDQKRILNYNNREALANWIYSGLLMDFDSNKK